MSSGVDAANNEPAAKAGGDVCVVCRVRPAPHRPGAEAPGSSDAAAVAITDSSVEVPNFGLPGPFCFDSVLGVKATQSQVYDTAARDVVHGILEGFNGAVLCYGQTGSGKTFTLEGDLSSGLEGHAAGIIPRAATDLFEAAEGLSALNVICSLVEIYNEKVQDLLSPGPPLKIQEIPGSGFKVQGCREVCVKSAQDLLMVLQVGASNRSVAATNMNETSSRSHSIFSITATHEDVDRNTRISGTLHLVDLAGSERQKSTKAEGERLDEAKKINSSLSALGNVISALTQKTAPIHVPYRDSKLTQLLREALGGNARTALIVTVSPSMADRSETVSTLRFGQRAKLVENKSIANVQCLQPLGELREQIEQQAAEIRRLRAKNADLEALLRQAMESRHAHGPPHDGLESELTTACPSTVPSPREHLVQHQLEPSVPHVDSASSNSAPYLRDKVQDELDRSVAIVTSADQEQLMELVLRRFGASVDARRFAQEYEELRVSVSDFNLHVNKLLRKSVIPCDSDGQYRVWQPAVEWNFTSGVPRLHAQLAVYESDRVSVDAVPPSSVSMSITPQDFMTMKREMEAGYPSIEELERMPA